MFVDLTRDRHATASSAPQRRLPIVDAARAVALLAMASYHTLWDLGHLRLTAENYALTPTGRLAAELIAGSFLVLVGFGLVLMNGRGVRLRPTLLRLLRIGGAALLVTLGTWAVFPDAFVFFGVLHCIAFSSLLGLPFLFLPAPVTAFAAAVVLAAPHLGHASVLDAPALSFLGLGSVVPRTNDYVPLFPWFGMVLVGIVLGRVALPPLARSPLGAWAPRTRIGRAATFAGRHSLAIYLIHQPVLLALLTGLVTVAGANPRAGLRAFRADYVTICTRTGGEPPLCRIAARCTSDALLREDLFREDGRPFSGTERLRAQAISQGCYATLEAAARAPH
ncbi:heparan-alpha-glucosaminide N-acetyltransferase [Methylobacterium sp. P5_C11]